MAKESLYILKCRRMLKITQDAMCEKYGIGISTLRDWERGDYCGSLASRLLVQLLRRDYPEILTKLDEEFKRETATEVERQR